MAWVAGGGVFLALVFRPRAGLAAFWNVLIPVAPALLAFAPGLWRNLCPLGSTALLPRHLGLSRRRRLSPLWQGRLGVLAVGLLFLLVPLRHALLNRDGPATALTLALLAVASAIAGLLFEWKSAWCSGACPVHPAERIYGAGPAVTPPNAHCGPCGRCVSFCPDSTTDPLPLRTALTRAQRAAGLWLLGAFPGFVWGWFHVPDGSGDEGWRNLGEAYALPLACGASTFLFYLLLLRILPRARRRRLDLAFAASVIACYYWYRIPALFGRGLFPGDGILVDLSASLPSWFESASRTVTTALFGWWFLARSGARRPWLVRPPFSAAAA